MKEAENIFPMHVGIVVTSAAQLASVYALLGGVALAAIGTARPQTVTQPAEDPGPGKPEPEVLSGGGASAPGTGEDAGAGADVSGEIDAHGHPWSAALHASTKGKTKDGLWRMKVGVSRPAPLPGFPKDDAAGGTGTSNNGAGSGATGSAGTGAAGPAAGEDEDEFAAFRAAADKAGATDAAAAANVPARKWTDADLGALCNQAAVKLGDPAPVKAVIAEFVPEGQVPHSRNIPDDRREAFAQKVEQTAGITFAG